MSDIKELSKDILDIRDRAILGVKLQPATITEAKRTFKSAVRLLTSCDNPENYAKLYSMFKICLANLDPDNLSGYMEDEEKEIPDSVFLSIAELCNWGLDKIQTLEKPELKKVEELNPKQLETLQMLNDLI